MSEGCGNREDGDSRQPISRSYRYGLGQAR
jgi:hypothetical protein